MKRLALLLALTFTLSLPAQTPDPVRHAKAQEMLSLLHMDRLLAQMMDGMMKQTSAMVRQMGGASVTAELQIQLETFQKKVYALVESKMGWKVMEPTYVDLYANTFTEAELDGAIAFYKSPAGMAIIEKTPGLTAQTQGIAQQKVMLLLPQVEQLVKDFTKDAAAASTGKS